MMRERLQMKTSCSFVPFVDKVLALLFFFTLFSLTPVVSFAQAFTATHLDDYGNVTVMEAEGAYDLYLPDGSHNQVSREEIAKEFYKTHTDDYDFLVIFSNFDYGMVDEKTIAFYTGVQNDTSGLGMDLFDRSSYYGSSGNLQGTIDMGNIKNPDRYKNVTNPRDPDFNLTLHTLSHEILHRWAAKLKFKDEDGIDSDALLGNYGSHWSFLLDSSGSTEYGNEWRDNGDGTFTSLLPKREMKYYGPIDLYLMGMIDKSEVPPLTLIESPDVDKTRLPEAGVTISGTARTITIDDIIAAVGERNPAPADSQKSFKTAFIYVTRPGTFAANDVVGIENVRNAFVTRFSILTDGAAMTQVASTLKKSLPEIPGVTPPETTPRTTVADVNEGVAWLLDRQEADGSWKDLARTAARDTAEALLALADFETAGEAITSGLGWLGLAEPANTDYLARKVAALAASGEDTSAVVQELLTLQNMDGGWGSAANYASSPADTALALNALVAAGHTGETVFSKGVAYLQSVQKTDGGWGSGSASDVLTTSAALKLFGLKRQAYPLDEPIANGTNWLLAKQNSDGGFGNSPSTVYNTAEALLALKEVEGPSQVSSAGIDYLLSMQSGDGSWQASPYQTALAVNAVWKTTVDPDLSIKSDDITFIPEKLESLPSNIVINADIKNLGRTDVPEAKVVLYDGEALPENIIGEQTLAFPGNSSTSVTFQVAVEEVHDHIFRIVADAGGIVAESSETNNSAAKILIVVPTYDLEITDADVTLSAAEIDKYQNVKVTADVRNGGTADAYDVRIEFLAGEGESAKVIATKTIPLLAANGAVTVDATWTAGMVGQNLPITVKADPLNAFAELSEENNEGVATLTVNDLVLTDPNLSVLYSDISIVPNPVNEGDGTNITASISNNGYSEAANIDVNFYDGVPGSGGELLGSRTIQTLGVGESVEVSVEWPEILEPGSKVIYVEVDPANLIKEVTEQDNNAFSTLFVKSLPDLSVSADNVLIQPAFPKEGDQIVINGAIRNEGLQAASDVTVYLMEGESIIGTETISRIEGNSVETATFTYNTVGRPGSHEIAIVADPENSIEEKAEDNNSAAKSFEVQSMGLSLSEHFISPNGDGINDSTTLSFTLDTEQTVEVRVVDEEGNVVASFSGEGLEDAAADQIVWDGYTENGTVASDGAYRFEIVSADGEVLGSLEVVVDNNGISVFDAMKRGTAEGNDLSCKLVQASSGLQVVGGDKGYKWLADGSGAIFLLGGLSGGLRKMSTDGLTITDITPEEIRLRLVSGVGGRWLREFTPSPDGKKVALMVKESLSYNSYYSSKYELWVMDTDGSNATLFDARSFENPYNVTRKERMREANNAADSVLRWSPDSRHVGYVVRWWDGTYGNITGDHGLDIWKVDVETAVKEKVFSAIPEYRNPSVYDAGYYKFEWSPNGSHLSVHERKHLGGSYSDERALVWIIDNDGTYNKVLLYDGNPNYKDYYYETFTHFRWVDDSSILMQNIYVGYRHYFNDYSLNLYDINAPGNKKYISGSSHTHEISLDRKKIMLGKGSNGQWSGIANVYDIESGSNMILYGTYGISSARHGISKDGRKVASAYSHRPNTNVSGKPHLDVFDLSTFTIDWDTRESTGRRSIDLSVGASPPIGGVSGLEWTANPGFVIVEGALKEDISIGDTTYDRALYMVNVETGEITFLTYGELNPLLRYNGDYYKEPLQFTDAYSNTFLFNAYTDDGPACTQKTSNFQSLWTMGAGGNLKAELYPVRKRNGVLLTGTASDIHFGGYKLEYALADEPSSWHPIVPYAEQAVVNGDFTSWSPPQEGRYLVRLTAWDQAGNSRQAIAKTFWGDPLPIANIRKNYQVFSPNGDEIKDSVEISYQVVEPVHLEFEIYDSEDQLVRTFIKDHATAGNDVITWDGKDESLEIVPDGKYRVKVLDFEIFVEVDNTPPLVNVELSQIKIDADDNYYSTLSGYAYDPNILHWEASSGDGENPDAWNAIMEGNEALFQTGDEYDNTAKYIEPPNALIQTYYNTTVTQLAGKKLMITAEDRAGNIATMVSGGKVEQFKFFYWDEKLARVLTPDLIEAKAHRITAVETMDVTFDDIVLQYTFDPNSPDIQWFDATGDIVYEDGVINIDWDNTEIGRDFSALRIKGADSAGISYYSSVLETDKLFKLLPECPGLLSGYIGLYEELSEVRILVQPEGASQWITLKVYSADNIPSGKFGISIPDTYGTSYDVRMEADAAGGEGNDYTYGMKFPLSCGTAEVVIKVDYEEADCGAVSEKATISVTIKANGVKPQSLEYFITTPEGRKSLKRFNLNMGLPGPVIVDLSGMPVGSYPVTARLKYVDNYGTPDEELANGTLLVDRTLPTADITYPSGNSMMACPVIMTGQDGDWKALAVEGVAADENGVEVYRLLQGPGDDPASWLPVKTWKDGKETVILGDGAVSGALGNWDISEISGDNSLKLKVVDKTGNASCSTVSFSIDAASEINRFYTDNNLFSPNGDGTLDQVEFSYDVPENASLNVTVVGSGASGAEPIIVKTLLSGHAHAGGSGSNTWNGKGDDGAVLGDGTYTLKLKSTDSCGNSAERSYPVEIDNTPPQSAITYPSSGGAISPFTEVLGTSADKHFVSYTLQEGEGAAPDGWSNIASSTGPVNDGKLGVWNISEATGIRTLKLTSVDKAGNESEATAIINLDDGSVRTLINDFAVTPSLISPNNDGMTDTSNVNFQLTENCDVKMTIIDSSGSSLKTIEKSGLAAGGHALVWDGTGDNGSFVSDGVYKVVLKAISQADADLSQTAILTVDLDTTLPEINITTPQQSGYYSANVAVSGSVADLNMSGYSIRYSGGGEIIDLDSGGESRNNYTFGTLNASLEGSYTLHVSADDLAGNHAEKDVQFMIDKTEPQVVLDSLQNGAYFVYSSSVISLTGSIDEEHPESYSLRYGPGDNPAEWTEVSSDNTAAPGAQLFNWNLGDGLPDGAYTLSLLVKDKAGNEGEARALINIDTVSPQVNITAPVNDSFIKGLIDVTGTAYDENLESFGVDLAPGDCSVASEWTHLGSGTTSIETGILYSFETLPADGEYCLRVRVIDKAGRGSETAVDITVDTQPPSAPLLIGEIINEVDADLSWSGNSEPDIAGYNIYLNGNKLNADLLNTVTYSEQNLSEGSYRYAVKAVDLAGWESTASNEVKIRIDKTPPEIRISVVDEADVSGIVDIIGTAYSDDDFKEYRVFVAPKSESPTWELLKASPAPISNGMLAQWDVSLLQEGSYSIKLEAEDLSGNSDSRVITVNVDHTPPTAPVLISATPGYKEINLKWQENSESDVAGYVLFRDDKIVNASDGTGNLESFLIKETEYRDYSLKDNKYSYNLLAIDRAGNISDISNTLEIRLNSKSPNASLVEPSNGFRFDEKFLVKATTNDEDIAYMNFEYKKYGTSTWTTFATVVEEPYSTTLDPVELGMEFGSSYYLRAMAYDLGGLWASWASSRKIIYTDLEPPATPGDVAAHVNGNTITLTWAENQDEDLAGYNVYNISSSGYDSKKNSQVITDTTYELTSGEDDAAKYFVKAVDIYDNESEPSETMIARIYKPQLVQPESPNPNSTVQVSGQNATAGSTVEVFVDRGQGYLSVGTAVADAQGAFAYDLDLSLGETNARVRATDADGNVSLYSDEISIFHDPAPAAPEGLVAVADGYNVNLTWNPSSSEDVAGYEVFRDGESLNPPVVMSPDSSSAHERSYDHYSYRAIDGNMSSRWYHYNLYGNYTTSWFEVGFDAPQLIKGLDIYWYRSGYPNSAKDYEIQAWSGSEWIPQKRITGNSEDVNAIRFDSAVETSRLRIWMTEFNYPSSSKRVGINEIVVYPENLIRDTSFEDSGLTDSAYEYYVKAVDNYGLYSPPSNVENVVVGDIFPPAVPTGFEASVSGPDLTLSWLVNTESDLAGYYLYKKNEDEWQKLNSSLLTEVVFSETGLMNGEYFYRVTAVDLKGHESAPSEEVTALVAKEMPLSPVITSVNPSPEGSSLTLTLEYPDSSAAAYYLYRSTVSGGPYGKIKGLSLTENSYLDGSLDNGTTYYYVTSAVDAVGNEKFSIETASTPYDSVAPETPVIISPTVAGTPVTVDNHLTNIAGFAEASATVKLYKDGILADEAGASSEASNEPFHLSYVPPKDQVSVSPDGKSVVYKYGSWLRLIDMATGSNTWITSNGNYPVWSPDGKKIVYSFVDNYGKNRLALYDLSTSSIESLTEDVNQLEDTPSWSKDGNSLLFRSTRSGVWNLWLKDVTSGLITQVTDYVAPDGGSTTCDPLKDPTCGISGGDVPVEPTHPSLSPDGTRVAYFKTQELVILHIQNGTETTVDTETDGSTARWSPAGEKLAFVSSRSGNMDVYVFDLAANGQTQLTESPEIESMLVWSPDGGKIAYVRPSTSPYSIWMVSAAGDAGEKFIKDEFNQISYMTLDQRSIIYSAYYYLNRYYLAGYFEFENVDLEAGGNRFYVVAADSANQSEPSEPITVVYDNTWTPDLFVSEGDISASPPYPVDGQETQLDITVWNRGGVDVSGVEADVYVWAADGNIYLLSSETIPFIGANTWETLSVTWDTSGNSGINRIIVDLDPEDKIYELAEDNNLSSADLIVTEGKGISMITELDDSVYSGDQDVDLDVALVNNDFEKDVLLTVRIIDELGNNVKTFDAITSEMQFGRKDYSFTWNASETIFGEFRVSSVLKDENGVLSENELPFKVSPVLNIDSDMKTDRLTYGPNRDVNLVLSLENGDSSYIIPEAEIKAGIKDSSGEIVFERSENIFYLLPHTLSNLRYSWNSALTAPGPYIAYVDTYIEGDWISGHTYEFNVLAESVVNGTISTPASVLAGSDVQVDYTLGNSGNQPFEGNLSISLIEPESGHVIDERMVPLAIAMNSDVTGDVSFSSGQLSLRKYTVKLTLSYDGTNKRLADASFTVIDGTPPVLSVVSPEAGKEYDSAVTVTVNASDNNSGIERVEFSIDGGTWQSLTHFQPVAGRYMGVWAPESADDGEHVIQVRATDRSGNASAVTSVTFLYIGDNVPPVTAIVVESPKHESESVLYVRRNTFFILNASDDKSGVASTEYHVDGGGWNAYGEGFTLETLPDGEHTLGFRSVDNVGNLEAEKTLSIVIDNSAPLTEIRTGDPKHLFEIGTLFVTGLTEFSLSVSDNLSGAASTEYRIDGGEWTGYSEAFALGSLSDGEYTFEFRSVDNMNNLEAEKTLAVIIDNSAPLSELSLGDPKHEAADGKIYLSGQAEFTLNASDAFSDVSGLEYRLDSGEWTGYVPFSISSEGTHWVEYRSSDTLGNLEMTRAIEVVVDITAPLTEISTGDPKHLSETGTLFATGLTEFSLSVSDNLSGVKGTEYRIDSGDWIAYAPFTVNGEGEHLVEYRSVDNVENSEAIRQLSVTVDNSAPVSELSIGDPLYSDDGTTYVRYDSKLIITATDNLSVVAKTEYRVDGGVWVGGTELAITEEGSHTIEYRSRDNLGNLEGAKHFDLVVDNSPPVSVVDIGTPKFVSGEGELFVSGQTMMTPSAVDNDSGVGETGYSIDGGLALSFASFTLPEEGVHVISYSASDNLGNQEDERELTVISDATPPETSISLGYQSYNDIDRTYLTKDTDVALSAVDSLAGVRNIYYQIDEGEAREYTGEFHLDSLEFGNHIIRFYSIDNVENKEAAKSMTVSLIGIDVSIEVLNLPRALVWTFDPSTMKGTSKKDYSLAEIKAFIDTALNVTDVYYQLVTDKEAFMAEFRSGIYNIFVIVDQDTPLGTKFNKELREAVNRGAGLVMSGGGNNIKPILEEVVGLKYNGSLSMSQEENNLQLYESEISSEQALVSKGKVLKTELDGATLAGVVKGHEVCKGIESVTLEYVQEISEGDILRVKLLVKGNGKKVTLLDEEEVLVTLLPLDDVYNHPGSESGDVSLSAISTEGLGLTLDVPFDGYLASEYLLNLSVEHADGSLESTGDLAVSLSCATSPEAGMKIGPLTVASVERDVTTDLLDGQGKIHENLPAVVVNEYGKGKAVLMTFDIVESAINSNSEVYAEILKNAVSYVLPSEEIVEASDILLLEKTTTLMGSDMDIRTTETLDSHLVYEPLFNLDKETLEYIFSLADGDSHSYRYFVRMPDLAGDFFVETSADIKVGGEYTIFDEYEFLLSIPESSSDIFGSVVEWLDTRKEFYSEESDEIDEMLLLLDAISRLPKTSPDDIKKILHDSIQFIDKLKQLSFDTSELRLRLDGYVKSLESRVYYQ